MSARGKTLLAVSCAVALLGFDAWAADSLVISQKKRTFNPGEISIHKGDTLHIENDDQFTHQVYVDSPSFKFESPESDPGNTIDLKFTTSGTFDVFCHIHPKMKLQVTVE
jgi:plastocyanin